MLENLFGNPVIEKVLFYLLVNKKCYLSQLKTGFQVSLYRFLEAFIQGA